MSYPYGQSGNPGYPGYSPQGYGQPSFPQPGYPPKKPGGGTAITAGILAVVQGLFALFVTVVETMETFDDTDQGGDDYTFAIIMLSILVALAAGFLSGGILLLCHRKAGRFLVIATSGLFIVGGLIGTGYGVAAYGLEQRDVGATLVGVSIVFLLELVTFCMAAVSSTGRWIEAREARAHAAATTYAPQPQYPYYVP